MESLVLMEVMDFLDVREREAQRVRRVPKVHQAGRVQWALEGHMDLLGKRGSEERMEFFMDKMRLFLERKEKKDLKVSLVPEDPRVTRVNVECQACLDCQELRGFPE